MIQFNYQEFQAEPIGFQGKFAQAMQDGAFYLQYPEELNQYIPAAMEYAKNLRTNTELKIHALGKDAINYDDIQQLQLTVFHAADYYWKEIFPNEVLELANAMTKIALDVIKKTFHHLFIPEQALQEKLTFFGINHYDPAKKTIGLGAHKDLSWIAVLLYNKAGLERLCGGQWEDIPPLEGHMVINYGLVFEVLMNSVHKLNACYHRVRMLEEKRISFVTFIRPNANTQLYRADDEAKYYNAITDGEFKEICTQNRKRLENEIGGFKI